MEFSAQINISVFEKDEFTLRWCSMWRPFLVYLSQMQV